MSAPEHAAGLDGVAATRPRVEALTRPHRLRPGARVAVVAPSGPVPEERLRAGLDILRGWDLDPVVAPHVLDTHPTLGHLAGADRARARDLTEAWCDPAVSAVICARGGFGAQRMVDIVDWRAIREAGPKVFVGYSDITALHEAFALRAGYATLHGPMVAAEPSSRTRAPRSPCGRRCSSPSRCGRSDWRWRGPWRRAGPGE